MRSEPAALVGSAGGTRAGIRLARAGSDWTPVWGQIVKQSVAVLGWANSRVVIAELWQASRGEQRTRLVRRRANAESVLMHQVNR